MSDKNYEKRLTKDITERFDSLTANEVNDVVAYYFKHLGGADGCEECFEEHYLCFDCEIQLADYVRKSYI